jgi:hypothetical protein
MRMDQVLTIDEFLRECYAAAVHVTPPIPGARHIAVKAGSDLDLAEKPDGCRCDRWGHPCLECDEHKVQAKTELPISAPAKQTG